MNRRDFLNTSLGAVVAAATLRGGARAASAMPTARIDTNVTLFPWLGRRLPHDTPEGMLALLRRHGVTQAWAGTFEGLLQRDLASANDRLAEACRGSGGMLLPFGTVNPALPGWEADVQRCAENHRMPGIRLYPNYHGYDLADERFKRLLGLAAERKLLVQLSCLVEDGRTQNPLLTVPDVDLAPLPAALAAAPGARVLLLNGGKFAESASFDKLMKAPGIFVDTARVETVGGVGRLLRRLPPGRVAFGSHAPFFIYEAAVIKMFESELTADEVRGLIEATPRALLKT